MARVRSGIGLVVLLLAAWAMSVDRRRVPWRVVIWGVILQLVFAFFILKTVPGEALFDGLNEVVLKLMGYTVEGARFLFGDLVYNNVPVGPGSVGNVPMVETPGQVARTGAFFAFNVLPTIIFVSSLMTVLYHLEIMQWLVAGLAWGMLRTMRTSGAETLSAAGNIFLGQTEAPLLVKPFVERMTKSELMAVMVGGFANVAGGVLVAYVGMLVAYFPDIAGHLIASSVMSAPASLVVAKLMHPEDAQPETAGHLPVKVEKLDVNVIDAAARGASEGLSLALNVGAMLIAFIALVAMANGLVSLAAGWVGLEGITIERLLGWVMAPIAWIMGVPWRDAPLVGELLGIKTVLNEFVAYLRLSTLLGENSPLAPRSILIASYALCGFANFSSIAMQIGGLGGMAPTRRHDISRLGMRAMIGGSIATFMTATMAGMMLG
ncbi:MAG: NupC/NupG family nucleoside CNT transporter [Gemmatimonadetes bacterium]|nr:NupC/NupG family nucleoside CNT transporter [Gemmatimonadota bacterium]